MEGARDEVEERAVPFREGDEVLVHIVEPHMYDVDDAVAKIDGYIVSVAGAGPLVGEKRLVRIEQAGRTSATAVLLDPTGSAGQPGTSKDGDDVQSGTRRRGRRGGRRRSRATADAAGAQDS
jgi:ribonuclease G